MGEANKPSSVPKFDPEVANTAARLFDDEKCTFDPVAGDKVAGMLREERLALEEQARTGTLNEEGWRTLECRGGVAEDVKVLLEQRRKQQP